MIARPFGGGRSCAGDLFFCWADRESVHKGRSQRKAPLFPRIASGHASARRLSVRHRADSHVLSIWSPIYLGITVSSLTLHPDIFDSCCFEFQHKTSQPRAAQGLVASFLVHLLTSHLAGCRAASEVCSLSTDQLISEQPLPSTPKGEQSGIKHRASSISSEHVRSTTAQRTECS